MMRTLAAAGLLAISTFMTACSGFLTSEQAAKQYYLLEPLAARPEAVTPPWPALALTVAAVPGLDTDRIQAIDTDSRLNYYSNARWADFLPEVLSSVMRRSLVASGQFLAVTTGSVAAKDGWSLALEVQQFYGIQSTPGSTSRVTATFEGLLRCNDQEHLLHQTASSTVGEERLSLVVKAHQLALDGVTKEILSQIKTHCH